MTTLTRRTLLSGFAGMALGACARPSEDTAADPLAPYRTPYKHPRLVLAATGEAGAFDGAAVDKPFVFRHDGRFLMTYVGFDGQGYQTGLAESGDLLHWRRRGLILGRDPDDPVTRHNIAMDSILRENTLHGAARLKQVDGRYLGAWNAYPLPGYEEGPAVIGLAWSEDLVNWERTAPILVPDDGADWERGGLYKPTIMEHDGTFYLYYNAKNEAVPWNEQIGVATSTDLVRWTRHAGNPIVRNGPAGAPDDRFAANPVVLQHEDRWAMYYFGLSTDRAARELLAIGRDPLNFEKAGEPVIDVGPPGSVDETYAHKPSLIHHDGVLYHFYCAVSGKWPNETRGIAVARSEPW